MAKLTLTQTVEALAAQVAALTALVAAQSAPKAPKAQSPAQEMFTKRTAGTCVKCGRADFRTPKGALTHVLQPDGATPCVRDDARDAGFSAK